MPRRKVCDVGPQGPSGPIGDARQDPIPFSLPGTKGVQLTDGLAELSALPAMPPILWLTRLQHQAELDFLNGSIDACTRKLEWITRLHAWWQATLPAGATNPLDFALDKVRSIAACADAGLDVFGKDDSYVPLLTYGFLSDHLSRQLENARIVEQEVKKLSVQRDDQVGRRNLMASAAASLTIGVDVFKQKIRDSFKTSTRLQDEVAELRETLDKQYIALLQTNETFQSAVRRKSRGCGFRETLSFVAMVATVASTVSTGAAAFSAGMTALKGLKNTPTVPDADQSWYLEISAEIKQIGKIVSPAGKSFDEFQKSYDKAKKAIAEFENSQQLPNLPNSPSTDYVKLVANKGDFDREIQKFRDMPEAQAYKRQMDLFVATCETRNNKIIEHDSIVRSIWDQWATIRAMTASTGQLISDQAYDYSIDDAVETLSNHLRQIKWDLLRGASLLSRILEYVSGSSNLISYDDRSVGAVASTIAQVEDSYIRSLESVGVGEHATSGLSLPLRDVLTDEAAADLLAGRPAYFMIPTDHPVFKGRYNLTTKRIGLRKFPRQTKNLLVRFEHQGRSVMVFRDGSLRTFTHVPVATNFQLDHEGIETDIGTLLSDASQKRFAGVSPFGPWKILLDGSKEARQSALAARLNFDVLGRALPF